MNFLNLGVKGLSETSCLVRIGSVITNNEENNNNNNNNKSFRSITLSLNALTMVKLQYIKT